MEIRLTPTGQLRWEVSEEDAESALWSSLRKAFEADWREGPLTQPFRKGYVFGSLWLCLEMS